MTAQQILQDLTAKGAHLWVEGDQLKIDAPIGLLTDDTVETLRTFKPELLAALTPKPGICPACKGALDLQDKARDCWWCAGCREFFHSNGQLMARPVTPQPAYREIIEARQLIADLVAAGCTISVAGGEVAIGNLGKASADLWKRLEDAGPDFVRAAREYMESFEAHDKWIQ